MFIKKLSLTLLLCCVSFATHAKKENKSETLHDFCSNLASKKYQGVEGLPNILVMRGCAWMKAGIIDQESEGHFLSAARKGNGKPASPEWIQEFTKVGDIAFKEAETAEMNKNKKEAHKKYELASHFFYMARWPHMFSKESTEAFKKHVIAYRKAGAYLNPPIQELKVPYDGKTIVAHLRLPSSDKPLPLIVFSPGIDDWKGEMNDFINPMLKAGFATLVVDLPGTGESEYRLAPGSHKVFTAAINFIKKNPKINADKIGFYGLSGGGYFATAMALTNPNVKASVNIGGPVHYSFTKQWLEETPKSVYATITRCAGLSDKKIGHDQVLKEMAKISLAEQGLVNPSTQKAPLLTINGEQDFIAHRGEYRFLDEKGINQDTLIFENDGHVAPAHFDIHIPFSINWLKKKMMVR